MLLAKLHVYFMRSVRKLPDTTLRLTGLPRGGLQTAQYALLFDVCQHLERRGEPLGRV